MSPYTSRTVDDCRRGSPKVDYFRQPDGKRPTIGAVCMNHVGRWTQSN